MLHRLFTYAALAALTLAFPPSLHASGEPAKPSKKNPPNIVIVLADDLGYGDLGCYGHPHIKTPNLDRFARQGIRFTQFYSAGAVCSPSRSAILTGRTPYRNGVYTWIPEGSPIHLRPSEITIATLLRQAGYATCHVGKWHLNGLFNSPKQPQPSDHGYDWWLATQNNAAPGHKDPKNFVRNGQPVGPMKGYSSSLIVEEAIHWLQKERDPARPFLLSVWFHEPHLPIVTDPKFVNLYPDLKAEDKQRAIHHGNVSQMDHAFGLLMRALDEMGLADNTLVIFTSDNGPEGDGRSGLTRGSTGGLRGRKRSVYAGGIQVPGILRWPGRIKPGSACQQPAIGSDIFTTVCDITGIALPGDRVIDGASLTPAFDGQEIQRRLPMYWRCPISPEPMKIALRQGDWKILSNLKKNRFELYNLKEDPREKNNLALKEPQKLLELMEVFRKVNEEIEREGPDWWREAEREQLRKISKKAQK